MENILKLKSFCTDLLTDNLKQIVRDKTSRELTIMTSELFNFLFRELLLLKKYTKENITEIKNYNNNNYYSSTSITTVNESLLLTILTNSPIYSWVSLNDWLLSTKGNYFKRCSEFAIMIFVLYPLIEEFFILYSEYNGIPDLNHYYKLLKLYGNLFISLSLPFIISTLFHYSIHNYDNFFQYISSKND